MFTIFGGIVTALGLTVAVIAPTDSTPQNLGEGALVGGAVGTIATTVGASNPVAIGVGAAAAVTTFVVEELK